MTLPKLGGLLHPAKLLDWTGKRVLPVAPKAGADVLNLMTNNGGIEVTKTLRWVAAKIGIADVTTTYHCEVTVDNPRFVMHAMIQLTAAKQHFDRAVHQG